MQSCSGRCLVKPCLSGYEKIEAGAEAGFGNSESFNCAPATGEMVAVYVNRQVGLKYSAPG